MALSTLQILQLPQKVTSRVRELQWGMEWYEKQYKEAKAHEDIAWKVYDDAIESGASTEEKNSIFIACKVFEANRIAAYRDWQECKRQYLELLN